jgi:glucosyl-dolichyl phosphate glucuronosyltransferase
MADSTRRRPSSSPDVSVLICTYNRADLLAEMLQSLAVMRDRGAYRWEVVIVDNNSTDHTRQLVIDRRSCFPATLRYIFEARQGKSVALNTGIGASAADVILFTDDDQRVGDDWVDEACDPLRNDRTIGYTGGPVWPIWDAPRPSWLDLEQPEMLGPIGMFDYGPERFVFEDRQRAAGGGNMAVKRALIDRVGGFHVELGRKGQGLLGQEQAEFFSRTRRVGARGLYVPTMQAYHHVPESRMTKSYFRRWWYWRGISRARLDGMHPITESGLDLSRVTCVGGVPRFMFGDVLREVPQWLGSAIRSSEAEHLASELRLAYLAGYINERRRHPVQTAKQSATPAPPQILASPTGS